jgi:hypothetical protein
LLQLKSAGSNPSQLSDVVAGTYDLGKFYENNQSQLSASLFGAAPSLNVNARGQPLFQVSGSNVVVPSKELWYVTELLISCNLLAAEYIRFAPMISPPGSLGLLQVGPDYNDAVTARVRFASAKADRPFFAPSGTVFGIMCYDCATAGNIAVGLELRAVRMQI